MRNLNQKIEQLKQAAIPEDKILYASPEAFGQFVKLEDAIAILTESEELETEYDDDQLETMREQYLNEAQGLDVNEYMVPEHAENNVPAGPLPEEIPF